VQGVNEEEYAKYMREVTDKLFTALSLGLGLEGHALKEGAGGEEIEYMLKLNKLLSAMPTS
jgi:flavonol synthase